MNKNISRRGFLELAGAMGGSTAVMQADAAPSRCFRGAGLAWRHEIRAHGCAH
jgi:hypothetical protein